MGKSLPSVTAIRRSECSDRKPGHILRLLTNRLLKADKPDRDSVQSQRCFSTYETIWMRYMNSFVWFEFQVWPFHYQLISSVWPVFFFCHQHTILLFYLTVTYLNLCHGEGKIWIIQIHLYSRRRWWEKDIERLSFEMEHFNF